MATYKIHLFLIFSPWAYDSSQALLFSFTFSLTWAFKFSFLPLTKALFWLRVGLGSCSVQTTMEKNHLCLAKVFLLKQCADWPRVFSEAEKNCHKFCSFIMRVRSRWSSICPYSFRVCPEITSLLECSGPTTLNISFFPGEVTDTLRHQIQSCLQHIPQPPEPDDLYLHVSFLIDKPRKIIHT